MIYANLLGEKIAKYQASVWLINTGWTGGPYGTGQRMKLAYTRAIVANALNGTLEQVPTRKDPIFGMDIPLECAGVPTEVLEPRNTWQDKAAYDVQAQRLAGMFTKNFQKFVGDVPEEIRAAGPRER